MAQRVFQATILIETNNDSPITPEDVQRILEDGDVEEIKVTNNVKESLWQPLIYFKEIKNEI